MTLRKLKSAGVLILVPLMFATSSQLASAAPTVTKTLSNQKTFTSWANADSTSPIFSQPNEHSQIVSHLHYLTSDNLPAVFLVLKSQTGADGVTWYKIAFSARPNGQEGWVLPGNLNPLTVDRTFMLVDLGARKLTLYKEGKEIFSTPIGVGRPSLPTPVGHFWVQEEFRSNDPFYGPWAVGTSAYAPSLTEWPGGGVVGIHGTNQPSLIPGDPSHGCVRLRDSAITELISILPIGTPIDIVQ